MVCPQIPGFISPLASRFVEPIFIFIITFLAVGTSLVSAASVFPGERLPYYRTEGLIMN